MCVNMFQVYPKSTDNLEQKMYKTIQRIGHDHFFDTKLWLITMMREFVFVLQYFSFISYYMILTLK